MRPSDADAVVDLMHAVWGVEERGPALLRARHLIGTDPGGAWVTQDGGGVVDGAALALLREGLWGLSLLIVRPDRQSAGCGRALLGAATAYGADARGGIVIASSDPRALRSYWRAGYALRPAFDADGPVRHRPALPATVREGRWPADRALVDELSRAQRGAAHSPDTDALLAAGCRLLVHDDGGYVFAAGGRAVLLAARGERVARALLEAVLHDAETGTVWFLDGEQQWAIDVVLAAGLSLRPAGATCVRGDVGPMRPYLPSGAYL
jgi:GNAT superfamily N-acetyltransferase